MGSGSKSNTGNSCRIGNAAPYSHSYNAQSNSSTIYASVSSHYPRSQPARAGVSTESTQTAGRPIQQNDMGPTQSQGRPSAHLEDEVTDQWLHVQTPLDRDEERMADEKLPKTKKSNMQRIVEATHVPKLLRSLFGFKTLQKPEMADCTHDHGDLDATAALGTTAPQALRQNPEIIDCANYYRDIDATTAPDTTLPRTSRLPSAASRESKGSKRQLKTYKSQPMSENRALSEAIAPDGDDFCHDTLEEIMRIGEDSPDPATRALFDAAFANA